MPESYENINKIIEDIKKKPLSAPEKRDEIRRGLTGLADSIDRSAITELRNFRPLGMMSEFGAAMGAEPRKGVRIDTPYGPYVFDEKRIPSNERVNSWYAQHKEAEGIRTIAVEYGFGLGARPNTVTGNFRVVERGRRFKEQGILSPEEEQVLNALEKYWQEHPEFDRMNGYGVWGHDLEIMVPENLRKNMTEKKGSLIDALLRIEPGKDIRIDYNDVPKGVDMVSLPPNLRGIVVERRGDLLVAAIQSDREIVAYLYVQKGSQLIQIRPIPRQKTPTKEGEVNTIEYNMWVERIKKEAPEYLPEWEKTAKQPWEMTRNEAIAEAAKPLGPMGISWGEMRTALSTSRKFAESMHKDMVKLAIVERKPVPPEVLKEYPDLITKKKEPWEMTYREFADFFIDVWGGQKFTFAERVGKPLGIQSQAGEPYHMIKGKRIGYSGSLERDRWRLAIVDKALSEGKTVPEYVLTELSESLKHEKEKSGGTGMAEQYEEKPPGQEVRDWMKRALGIEDYKGGRHDRIQMLALLIQNSELGNIRSISDSGSMALALGKDLGYGTPPAYGMSLERYYAEKIAAETGKEVPIIKSSDIIKPPVKITDVKAAFEKHFMEYNRLSLLALTQLNDADLAENITTEIQGLSREDALKVAPQMRSLMEYRIKELEEQEVKARPPAPEGPKVDFWGMVKDLKITEVQVEFAPGEPSRGYKNIYLYTYALLENGKKVRMNEEMFKGHDVAEAQKMGEEQFRQRKLYMIGETVEKNMRESSFLFLNRYEEYVKQAPVAVQKRFEESGAIAGGTPARHILRITEPEEYYFGTQIEVLQGVNPELEPYFTGTIKRLLNNGELVEVHPEGDPREVSFRVPVDRVNVIRLVHQGEPKKIKELSRYYYSHRPPGIGTQPEGYINYESWLPATTTPHGRTAFGWVEYDSPLAPEEISRYELFEDEVELPKLVRELVQFARDEGIDEAMKAIDAEYGRAVWDWLKAQKRIRAGLGQKEQIRAEIIRLAGMAAAPMSVPQEAPAVEIEPEMKPIPLPAVEIKSLPPLESIEDINELKKRENYLQDLWIKIDLVVGAYDKEIRTLIHTIPDPGKRLNRALELDKEKHKLIDELSNVGRELRLVRDKIMRMAGITVPSPAVPPAIQPSQSVQARFNAYISSTVLTTGALASPKFLSDEKMAQDIERNIQVSKDEARALVPQFRAIAEKMINKEEVESIKELFGIDVEQEAHKLGIDLADYVITKAGNMVVLQHKTIVQRQYRLKSPAEFIKKQEEETQERLREAQRRKAMTVPAAAPPAAKPAQSIQEIKQQVLDSIQAARSVEELQPVLKGIGFLPIPEPEKRQVMDAYQNRYSILMSERPFGVPVKGEEKPKAIGAPTPQQLFEAEQRRKAGEARRISAAPTLTGGAVTSRRLEMFEPSAMEKAKAEAEVGTRIEQLKLPYEVHPYIRKLAAGTQDVMKFGAKRGRETVDDLVLARYVRYCPPGTIIDNRSVPRVPERWWVYPPKLRACMSDIEKKLAEAGTGMVKEREATQLTSSMRSYIQGAQAVRDVIHYYRDGRTPTRGVLYRARDGTYFVEAQDGQVYASMGWEDVSIAGMPPAGRATA